MKSTEIQSAYSHRNEYYSSMRKMEPCSLKKITLITLRPAFSKNHELQVYILDYLTSLMRNEHQTRAPF